MPDITMCTQSLCPNAMRCIRTLSTPSDWQSWATFEYTIGTDGVNCDFYMPAYETTATDNTDDLPEHEKWRYDCAETCTCGAWGWSKEGKPVHIADCICGAG